MKKLIVLLITFLAFASFVFAGDLFNMDFSDSAQQAQILKERDAIVLLYNDAEFGTIMVDKIHGQNVDVKIYAFATDSRKLVGFITLNSDRKALQVDTDNDGLADFSIEMQSPVDGGTVRLAVKRLFGEDTESAATVQKNEPSPITGGVVESDQKSGVSGFLVTALLIVVGLVLYYIFTKKKQ